MATLLAIRTALNLEIGVVTDGEATPWSTATRSQAIADGYAALYRAGVWKAATQTISTVTDAWTYALTSIRRHSRVELLDTSSRVLELPRAIVEEDGVGGWQLRLADSIPTGSSLRVRGWTPYVSVFADDAAVDDLPAEYARLPRLKAKAILWRIMLGSFARYSEKMAVPPEQSVTVDMLLAMVAAAEREWLEETKALSNLRPRSGQVRRL